MPRPSLLKDLLRKNSEASGHDAPKALTSRRGMKEFADSQSIKSVGGNTIRSVRSIAGSIASFYSFVGGGTKVAKRRRPDISRLGVPKFYNKNPKEPEQLEGVKPIDTDELGPYTAAHARSFRSSNDPKPCGSIVLYSHAAAEDTMALYHGRAKIHGELRIRIDTPSKISSIDVWLIGQQESIMDLSPLPFVNATANLWNPRMGDPSEPGINRSKNKLSFKGKMPAGTYIFPFDFPALPRDVQVSAQKDTKVTRCFLPCSHEVSETAGWTGWQKYMIGVYIKKEGGVNAVDDEWNMKFQYFPRTRAIPRPEKPFPFLSSKEDWPFSREEVGGWLLTPFGGRGRFKDTLVEIEGILGVQAPVVYYPGQRLNFSLLLWCGPGDNQREALEALAQPEHIRVDYLRVDLFGLDVLEPHNTARKHRRVLPMAQGRVWRTDKGAPKDSNSSTGSTQDKVQNGDGNGGSTATDGTVDETRANSIGFPNQVAVKRTDVVPTRFRQIYVAQDDQVSEDSSAGSVSPDDKASEVTEVSEAERMRNTWLQTTTAGDVGLNQESVAIDEASTTPETKTSLPNSSTVDNDTPTLTLPNDIGVQSPTDTLPPSRNVTSPTQSIDEEDPENQEALSDEDDEGGSSEGHFIRMDGDVMVPASIPPNYRYLYSGIEYALHLLITHPDYSHISPRATGIIAESPLWITTDPPRALDQPETPHTPFNPATIPKTGEAIGVPPDVVRFPSVTGNATEKRKPSTVSDRTWAFL